MTSILSLAKAQEELVDAQERVYILTQVKAAKDELLSLRKKQLKKDTAVKIESVVDDKCDEEYEQSDEFQKQLKLKVGEILTEEESRRREMAMRICEEEGRLNKDEEEQMVMSKRKRVYDEKDEGTREQRINGRERMSNVEDGIPIIESTVTCDLYQPDDGERDRVLTVYCALRDASASTESKSITTYYASVLSTICPDLKDNLTGALKHANVQVREVNLPSDAVANLIDVNVEENDDLDFPSLLMIFGCGVLILFRNITDVTYRTFMTNRIRAMSERFGTSKSRVFENPFSFEVAQAVRSILGENIALKKELINFIVSASTRVDLLGIICKYLNCILAWSEMNVFTSICDTLLLTGSRVLLEPSVQSEVRRLADAYSAVVRHKMPEYFRYSASAEDLSKVQGNNFPILFAVAQQLKARSSGATTANQFVTAVTGSSDTIVNDLVKLHIDAEDARRIGKTIRGDQS